MNEHERKLHREAMQRYRKRYPDKHKAWGRVSTQRRRNVDPLHMKQIKERSAAKREDFLATLKRKPCTDCGQLFPPCVMEFDHVRGKKVKAVSQLRYHKFKTLMTEIAKCDLVCSNCHRMRTHKKTRWEEHIRWCTEDWRH